MINKHARLVIVLAKLMTAEKMKLGVFCHHDEYFSFRFHLPSTTHLSMTLVQNVEYDFELYCEVEASVYQFTNTAIDSVTFAVFENHLSEFLNELFSRKQESEAADQRFNAMVQDIKIQYADEDLALLANRISTDPDRVISKLTSD